MRKKLFVLTVCIHAKQVKLILDPQESQLIYCLGESARLIMVLFFICKMRKVDEYTTRIFRKSRK